MGCLVDLTVDPFLKMDVFHMACLVDLTRTLFEILMPNFMLVSPFKR